MKKTFLIIILIIVIVSVSSCTMEQTNSKELEQVTIAEAGQPIGALLYIALENNYFEEEGLNVTIKSYTSGKDSLNIGIIEENANFATTAETPIVLNSLNNKDKEISVIATIGTAKENMAIVAKKESGIFSSNDLNGKTIAVTANTNAAFFLDVFLLFNDLVDKVNIENENPEAMVDLLINNEVDAVTAWNPHLTKIQQELGENATYFSTEGIYTWTWNMVSTTEYVTQNPDITKKLLTALYKAEIFVNEKPDESIAKVADHLNLAEDELEAAWDILNLELSLEQSFLVLLEDQSRWAIENELTDAVEIPNYLDNIYLDALDEVKPSSVGIIQ